MNATYRLQLGPDFGFAEVQALLPYFRRLGITHLYLSPISEARQGSTHGYDVTDHNRIRQALGGDEGLDDLRAAAVAAGLGLILDVVPNHAGVGPHNHAWQDLLAYGPHSPSTTMFDIDWAPLKRELHEKLLLPFLGEPYGDVLDTGQIHMLWDDGRLEAGYFDHRFSVRPETYAEVLADLLPRIERTEHYWTVKEIYDSYASISATERDRAEVLHERLAAMIGSMGESVAGPFQAVLDELTGQRLHQILERQFWRLSYFKTAGDEINYRRFFDINELVALRMEEPEVFFNAHRKLGQLLLQEGITGVRVDHVDGLRDPHDYLARLRELGARHIWVEKILAHGEILPEEWPVTGTTGYEFLDDVVRLLNWPGGEIRLTRLYTRLVGNQAYGNVVNESKHLVMATSLPGELFRLAYELDRLSEADYRTRDFTLGALREALGQVVAAFGRYRTYLPHDKEQATEVIKAAIHEARRRSRAFEPSVYDFVEHVLLGEVPESLEPHRNDWVGRFQQYCAPVAAKGVEDTAFYRYTRLLALNDVGGEPDIFSQEPQVFHAHARFRAMRYPENLLATATHDHKRGEDTRMRLAVASQIAEDWARLIRQLQRAVRRHSGEHGPSASDAYALVQTMIALWGSSPREELTERLAAYMLKCARETKRETNWINPDAGYEADLDRFVRGMMRDRWVARAVEPMARRLARHGFINGITQLALKLTTPGVPDIYRGSELLDLSLVDPDNRRPVDYALRQRLLDELEPMLKTPDAATLRELAGTGDERFKFYVMIRLLRFRLAHPAPFAGSYQPLAVDGSAAAHVLAHAREGREGREGDDGELVAVVLPRFSAVLESAGGDLGDTRVSLPAPGRWLDVLSGQRLDSEGSLAVADLPLSWAVLHLER